MQNMHQTASGRGEKARTTNRAVARDSKPDLSAYPDRWFKCPPKGHCPLCGLTRPALYELAKSGKIRSAAIRKPGAIRGNRLFHLGSVLAFIDNEAEKTAAREVRP
jgi:hypothetical protein